MAKTTDETMVTPTVGFSGQRPDHSEAMNRTPTDFDGSESSTKSPYREANFIGTYCAIALGACGAFAAFVMPVTSLSLINADIGPSENITWFVLAYTLCSSVGFTLVGRLSDIFGRRWFFAGTNFITTIGCILGCTAQHVNQLIASSALIGLGAAGQISFNYVLGELVPIRHRFAANGVIFLCAFPFAGLGPYISRLFIARTSVGWRGDYYVALAINAVSTLCWVIWYHPPQFNRLHKDRTRMQEIQDMDFGGIFLYTSGALLFLLGLSWGGELHPWDSAYVIATLVIGVALLAAFVLYEIYMPLRRPLIPMKLFRNYEYVALTVMSTVGGMVYYAMNLLFPQMIAVLFTTDIVQGGLLSCAVGGGVCCGQFLGSWLIVPGGNLRLKLIFIGAGLCAFIAGLAGATDSQGTAAALATCGGIMVGLLEVTASTAVTVVVPQSEIGTVSGVFGSLRGAGGVLASAVFVSILTNRLESNLKSGVVPALVEAGLPLTSLEKFLEALKTGKGEVPFDPFMIVNKAITIQGSTYAAPKDYHNAVRAVEMVHSRFPLVECVTHRFGLNDTQTALETVMRGDVVKGVIDMSKK